MKKKKKELFCDKVSVSKSAISQERVIENLERDLAYERSQYSKALRALEHERSVILTLTKKLEIPVWKRIFGVYE